MSGFGKQTDDKLSALFETPSSASNTLTARKSLTAATNTLVVSDDEEDTDTLFVNDDEEDTNTLVVDDEEDTNTLVDGKPNSDEKPNSDGKDDNNDDEDDSDDDEENYDGEDNIIKYDLLTMSGLPIKLYTPIAQARALSKLLSEGKRDSVTSFMLVHRLFDSTHSWNIPTGYSIKIILDKIAELGVTHVLEIAAGSGLITSILRFVADSRGLAVTFHPSDPDEEDLRRHAYIGDIARLDAVSAVREKANLFREQGKMVLIWSRARDFINELLEYITSGEFDNLDIVLMFYTEGYGMSCEPESFFDKLEDDGFNEVVSLDREESVEFFQRADKHDHLKIWMKYSDSSKKGAKCKI